ncbi:MAG TPA: FkbM family methyltransferase [Cyanobacteria bacterium UBA11162]|nr:FkbM family methyltransferase [Cyanobacteria bacterium UBA11162]
METSFAGADCYWNYLEISGLNRDSEVLSRISIILEGTSWDNPRSSLELNNVAVVALIEAEKCQDLYLRGIYLEMALEALNRGVELQVHPLCIAHLALALTLTGEMEQAMQLAFPTLINTLQPTYVSEQQIPPGLVYLPPAKDFTDSRYEQLTQMLQAEDGYVQSLMLLSEVLCQSQLVFYNAGGLRFLYLAAQLFPHASSINLKLGISSLINRQWEGLLYLHRAREFALDCTTVLQALHLAYRDLQQKELANLWVDMGRKAALKNSGSLEVKWTELTSDSSISYVPFERQLVLAIEPSFRSIVTSVLIAEGDWFEKEMEFWRNWIKPGMSVIDVGANVGVYTFSAALRVGKQGIVLAVEPFSGCVHCLQETCRINQLDWVKVCAGAASDRNGIARLSLHSASELNEVIESDNTAGSMESGAFEEVPCFCLDTLIERENISQVDVLKIDAEGHELKVLQGSNRILTEFAPSILYENISGRKGSNLAVADFLTSRGYELFRYQPYLQNLIPINSVDDLQGTLNIIALYPNKNLA